METVEIVDVGLRDGLQGIGPLVPTEWKLAALDRLVAAGVRRLEVGSLVSARAVPQMADTPTILAAALRRPGVVAQVLVPNDRRGLEAVDVGARHLVFVLSATDAHNRANVARTTRESVDAYERLLAQLPDIVSVRVAIATSFHCPYAGPVEADTVLSLVDHLVALRSHVEICFCDTTGGAHPQQVGQLFARARASFPQVTAWAFHAHDTYGLGAANVVAAYGEGVRSFDSAFGGLGGCPFAPGASGNVATEDLVRLFQLMAVQTGIDLDTLIEMGADAAALPGGKAGGHLIRVAAGREARACA
ncbi:hydroxymethylglutaryl-CoA lyase [Ancylobacter pratisalsi]|uniref:Hydroxymethylglutaryl-CoA lyase n=1 Tax=Ancylobacter pratisalsi TaxID=1745854 RepID=A0A6P1YMU8_9HYPH|nr:hydroxymethylglutaryl-CoA lyase [Ancylobacter pratisalsi]QIB33104.1 hydroxymethylglutaryl-CoA lyase [Ancylobacter pratisalsi]